MPWITCRHCASRCFSKKSTDELEKYVLACPECKQIIDNPLGRANWILCYLAGSKPQYPFLTREFYVGRSLPVDMKKKKNYLELSAEPLLDTHHFTLLVGNDGVEMLVCSEKGVRLHTNNDRLGRIISKEEKSIVRSGDKWLVEASASFKLLKNE